jgi:hypothetical protein
MTATIDMHTAGADLKITSVGIPITHGADTGGDFCNAYIVRRSITGYLCNWIASYTTIDWADNSNAEYAQGGLAIVLKTPEEIVKNYAGNLLEYWLTDYDGYGKYDYWELQNQCSVSAGNCAPAHEATTFSLISTANPTTTTPTDPAGWLDRINAKAPACVDSMTTLCPALYGAFRDHNNTLPESNFCSKLQNSSCPGLCLQGESPSDWLSWSMRTCANTQDKNGTSFATHWVDYDALTSAAYRNLLPWDWHLVVNSSQIEKGVHTSSASVPHCPSLGAKLLSFALINVIVFTLSLVLGRRDVINVITCRCCGKRGTRSWPWTALLSVCLHLMANLINALITRGVPGFHDASIGGLFLLWSSRPRLAWVGALLMPYGKEKSIYFGFGISTMLAEVVLQSVGAVYLGMRGSCTSRFVITDA